MEKTRVWEHVAKIGELVKAAWVRSAERHGLEIDCSGFPCLAHFGFKEFGLELKTLYTTLMLDEGFIANVSFYPTLAHNEKIVALYAEAIDRVFAKIAEIKKGGKDAILAALDGKVCQSGFKRLLK